MSDALRILMIVVSALVLLYVLLKIRGAKLNISDSIFWIVVAVLLTVLAVFPGITEALAALLGIQAPLNFLLILFIGILILKVFLMSIKISQQNERIKQLAQKIAYDEFEQRLKNKGDGRE